MNSKLNRYIHRTLSAGVITSLVLLLWGSILYLHNPVSSGRPGSVVHIISGTFRLDPIDTINLGLLCLLLTPVLRVVTAVIAFALEGDNKYVIISLVVLAVIIVSGLLGRG